MKKILEIILDIMLSTIITGTAFIITLSLIIHNYNVCTILGSTLGFITGVVIEIFRYTGGNKTKR